MKKYAAGLMTALALVLVTATAQAQESKPVLYQEGLHYALIEGAPVAAGNPLELVEAFSYMCSHCNTFEPYINAWKKRQPENVTFRRIPVVFGRGSWELYARGYVTAEMLNVGEQAHGAMMDRLWKEKNIMRSMDEIADFYSQFGVARDKFLATASSFAVDTRMKKDQLKVQAFGVTGTPSLILDGRYRIAGNAAVPSFDDMLDVVDYLIAKEIAGSQQSSAAAD
jgi:thiol:disulfide interchange protein DsbA